MCLPTTTALFVAALLAAQVIVCCAEEDMVKGTPVVRPFRRDDFEPQSGVLVDEIRAGCWNLRIKTWTRVPGDHMLNSNGPSAPDFTYAPRLEGRYDVVVGVRAVGTETDFGLKLTSEDEFTTIKPPVGTEARHWNLEIPWKQDVRLDGETIRIKNLGKPNMYLGYLKFVPLIAKQYQRPDAETIVICREAGRHFAFPGLTQARNGDLLVVCREGGTHAQAGDFGSIVLSRSRDRGRTWSKRVVVYAKQGRDARDPSILCLSDGAVVVTVYDGKAQIMRSLDHGHTWDAPTRTPVFSPNGLEEGPDGRLCYAGAWQEQVTNIRHFGVVSSQDHGRTWSRCAPVAMCRTWQPVMTSVYYAEPNLCVLPGGRWLVAFREERDGYLKLCASDDHGRERTWTWPERTAPSPIWGHPADLLPLQDGSLLCTYGYRREPTGIRACLSRDQGKTWDLAHEIILRDDGFGSDLGYPQSIQLEDGRVFTAYYMQTGRELPQIDGTAWRLPDGK